MKKKLICIAAAVLAVLVAVSIVGCNAAKGNSKSGNKQSVVLDSDGKIVITPGSVDKLTFTINGKEFKVGDPVSKMEDIDYDLSSESKEYDVEEGDSIPSIFEDNKASSLSISMQLTGKGTGKTLASDAYICGINSNSDDKDNVIKFSNGLKFNMKLSDFKEKYEIPKDDANIKDKNQNNYTTYIYSGTDKSKCQLKLMFNDRNDLCEIDYDNHSKHT